MENFEGAPPWLVASITENLELAGDAGQAFEERVKAADLVVRQANQYLADIVASGMVMGGHSWSDVGRALGVTRQAAFQRFRSAAQRRGEAD